MINVKANFRHMYEDLSCGLCSENIPQSGQHLLNCRGILERCQEAYNNWEVEYEDIFADTKKQLEVVRLFSAILDTKSTMESEDVE